MGNEVLLYGVGGIMAGNIFPLENTTTIIGRNSSKCSIIYPENATGVSGIHCQVRAAYPYLEITDLGSTYGTFYENGVKMQKDTTYRLQNNEAFYIGEKKNRFIVKIK
ncbi:MAG: FHA domain-containing protein [Lachnospiraceae bacterium]|nr:FHA domain-containing protein [Lachnospiraceae bacterium]